MNMRAIASDICGIRPLLGLGRDSTPRLSCDKAITGTPILLLSFIETSNIMMKLIPIQKKLVRQTCKSLSG
jgi:hypothetical protein